jgi:hypothetical protein
VGTDSAVKQPTPDATPADIERIIARDFPPDLHATVRAVLEQYGAEDFEREADRLRLACLKLEEAMRRDWKQYEDWLRR